MRKIRELIRLKYQARLSHEQIARALSISKGVVAKYPTGQIHETSIRHLYRHAARVAYELLQFIHNQRQLQVAARKQAERDWFPKFQTAGRHARNR
jgi:transcriptional regulator with XRE-family HTH domain